jgi:fucose permease
MWPIILSLAINSVNKNHETLTGCMFTATIGGALGPFIIGSLGDRWGLHTSLHYIYLPLLVVLSVAFWAKPLISNRTIRDISVKDTNDEEEQHTRYNLGT